MRDFKIVLTGHGLGELFVDGEPMKEVSGFDLKVRAGEINKVTVYFNPKQVEVAGEFEVTTIEDTSRKFAKGSGEYGE